MAKKNKLEGFTKEQLEEELNKRQEEEERASKPKMLAKPNLKQLERMVQSYIDAVAEISEKNGIGIDEDFDHYIFEKAIEAFFGHDVWEWVNKRLR